MYKLLCTPTPGIYFNLDKRNMVIVRSQGWLINYITYYRECLACSVLNWFKNQINHWMLLYWNFGHVTLETGIKIALSGYSSKWEAQIPFILNEMEFPETFSYK